MNYLHNLHTKGTGLLECFQCVETLVFVSKHTEGMSLRCDAPSLIVAGMNHRILSRLTRIQRDDYLWEFVADFLEHRLHGLYGYVGLLNLVESV